MGGFGVMSLNQPLLLSTVKVAALLQTPVTLSNKKKRALSNEKNWRKRRNNKRCGWILVSPHLGGYIHILLSAATLMPLGYFVHEERPLLFRFVPQINVLFSELCALYCRCCPVCTLCRAVLPLHDSRNDVSVYTQ